MPSDIHSIVFLRNTKENWTATKARKWLKQHGFIPIKRVDKKDNQLRYRLIDPKFFKSFMTKKSKNNINLVIGFYKDKYVK